MGEPDAYLVHPIGVVRSSLRAPADAPNQASEGAPEAVLEIDPAFADALHRVQPGDELILLAPFWPLIRGAVQAPTRVNYRWSNR